jgi:chitin disaccharide deacetylase
MTGVAKSMKEVIITADDFGMCQDVDDAIIDLIEFGTLTTTNVLTNMETLSNAKILRENYKHVSVGIHWNVTTGRPISDVSEISTLVNEDGEFYPLNEFKIRMNSGKINANHMKIELENQYKLFKQYCGEPDYWNTHENSVLNKKAYSVFSEVAQHLGIKSTRNFQRVYVDYDTIKGLRKIREILVKNYTDIWFGRIIRNKFSMPDGRLINFNSKYKLNVDRLRYALESTRKRTIEIVIHPSRTAIHPLFGNISEERVSEYNFFMSLDVKTIFNENTLRLANFTKVSGK